MTSTIDDRPLFKLLVCGSRTWSDIRRVDSEMQRFVGAGTEKDPYRRLLIFHGACPTGADRIADTIARDNGFALKVYPADWDRYGKKAGPRRNSQMVSFGRPDQGLAFGALYKPAPSHGYKRSGTGDMVTKMIMRDVPVRWISAPGMRAVDLTEMPSFESLAQTIEEECDCTDCQINGSQTH